MSPVQAASPYHLNKLQLVDLGSGFRALMMETAVLLKVLRKGFSLPKKTERIFTAMWKVPGPGGTWGLGQAGQEGRRGIHVVGKIWEMKVSEASEVEQSWSVDPIDTSQAAQRRGRCRGLLLLQATFRVLEVLEVEQEQAGQIYWSAFDGDGITGRRRRSENPLLQATLVSEVLEAEQPSSTGRQEVQGTPTSKAISELQWWECTGNCRE
ncbi:hypothetical protein B0H14DRAFT_2630386 [Mycena olivaceomarginata]|nr:hypothetical protein B0H14DRAFT_2630386 [Mycena olivaceomarginata]